MPMQEVFQWLAGALIGAIATLLVQEFMPERVKNKIRITAKKLKLTIADTKIPAKLIWKYSLGARVHNIEAFAEALKKALLQAGFNVSGLQVITAEARDGSRYEVILNYDEEGPELLSIHIEAREELSAKRLEGDLLVATKNEHIKELLKAIGESIRTLEDYAGLAEPELYIELQLKGLSSLSMLVEGLGIKIVLADSKYNLVISESGVSLLVKGFTHELLGLLRNLILLYA